MVVSRAYVDVPVGERRMRTFVAAPRTPGPHPGIVFYTDIFQLTESSLRWCVRLAGYGFVVAAPEIYHRREPAGTVLEFDDAGKERGQADAEATPVADFDADIRAALDFLGTLRGDRRARRSAPPGTAPAATSRSARRWSPRCGRRPAGTRPACTTASSARTPTPARSPAPARSAASC